MKNLLMILSLCVTSAICRQDMKYLADLPCANSRYVIEERPDVVQAKIVTDSGETLFDVNSKMSNMSDLQGLISELTTLLFPEENSWLFGNSSDYYITNNQTDAGVEVVLVSRPGVTVFRKIVQGSEVSAVRCAHIHGFNVVVDPAWDITKRDGYNMTSLLWACLFGMDDLAMSLVNKGADVNQRGVFETTPILGAIRSNRDDLVAFLIQKGADVSAVVGRYNFTPLHIAAYKGRVNIARMLIERGAPVNIDSGSLTEKMSPLHLAADQGHEKMVDLLISKGADVRRKTVNGQTPLHAALQSGFIRTGHKLLEAGADINAQDNEGNTPLMATWKYSVNEEVIAHIVEHLLTEHNPDINIKNKAGETALTQVTKKGYTKVQNLLKAKGSV